MSSLDDSSLEQTPVSSLSAASSYSSLVNCDEMNSIDQKIPIETPIYDNINRRSSHSTLLPRHVNRLCSILEKPIEIHGQGAFPTLNIVCKDFLLELRRAFHFNQIDIKDIRLNGGKFVKMTFNNEYQHVDCLSIFLLIRCRILYFNQ